MDGTMTLNWENLRPLLAEFPRRDMTLLRYGGFGIDLNNRCHLYLLLLRTSQLRKRLVETLEAALDSEISGDDLRQAIGIFEGAYRREVEELVQFCPSEVISGQLDTEEIVLNVSHVAELNWELLSEAIKDQLEIFSALRELSPSLVAVMDQLEAELTKRREETSPQYALLYGGVTIVALTMLSAQCEASVPLALYPTAAACLGQLFAASASSSLAVLPPEFRKHFGWL